MQTGVQSVDLLEYIDDPRPIELTGRGQIVTIS